MVMFEWPYVMLSEALVFVLISAGIISLQNTMTGVSYYVFPVLVSSTIAVAGISWTLSIFSLVLLSNVVSDYGDGLACSLLRGGRATCVVVLLHIATVGALCAVNTDPEMCVAMFSGNHLFPQEAALMYYVFAIGFLLCLGAVVVCVLVAQTRMIRSVYVRFPSTPVPRLSWNVNLLLVVLFETEVIIQHNTVNSFEPRVVYVSWQTLVAIPALLICDILCARLVVVSRTGAAWSHIMVILLHATAIAAFAVLVVLHPVTRSLDTLYVNAGAAALQLICTILDLMNLIISRQSSPAVPQTVSTVRVPQRPVDLFDIPVRSGVQSTQDVRRKRRPTFDLRSKKDV